MIGGSGSGKSAYAEQTAIRRSKKAALFYLATMQVYDAEGERKVARHRKMREGKGFLTIEQPADIAEAIGKIKAVQPAPKEATALLECMSNLVANEMFGAGEAAASAAAEKIIREVKQLKEYVSELIIVTNQVSEDGIHYDASTMEYIKALGAVNTGLAAMADTVVEVVVGIPVLWKGEGV